MTSSIKFRRSATSSQPALPRRSPVSFATNIGNFVHILWLFTLSDVKTFILPQTAFGVLGALSSPLLTGHDRPNLIAIFIRLPLAILWIWLNILIFNLSYQSRTKSVLEDKLNKPWRPIPAARISEEGTKNLLFISIPISLAIIRFCLGAVKETALLFRLTWMHNDLGGSDENFIVRNLIIAVTYPVYGYGALRIMTDAVEVVADGTVIPWSMMIAAIIFTTRHIQDLKDMKGDKARGRPTLPHVVGKARTRRFLACAIIFWSAGCSMYWGCNPAVALGLTAYAGLMAYRVVNLRSSEADRTTRKMWVYWLICIYGLPLAKYWSR